MRRRGFTLLEAIVACMCTVILGGTLTVIAGLGADMVASSSEATGNMAAAARATERLEEDYQGVIWGHILIGQGKNQHWQGNRVGLRTARDADGYFHTDADGNLDPQRFILYYTNNNRLLRRELKWWSTFDDMIAACDGQGTVLATGVTKFEVTKYDYPPDDESIYREYPRFQVIISLNTRNARGEQEALDVLRRFPGLYKR